MVVPGSGHVKRQAEAEGLDQVFRDAGFEWPRGGLQHVPGHEPRHPHPRPAVASTSNRNFEGRQGKGGRTHLVSPAMAAAAAIRWSFVDIRGWHYNYVGRPAEHSPEARSMQPFTTHTGIVAPLDRANVDTDQIIPKQFLKRIERTGFGQFCLLTGDSSPMARRIPPSNSISPSPPAQHPVGTTKLRLRLEPGTCPLGVGGLRLPRRRSPRRSPTSSIPTAFKTACCPSCCRRRMSTNRPADGPGSGWKDPYRLHVDLAAGTVGDDAGFTRSFTIDPFRRRCLLEGLDDIGLSLHTPAAITAWEQAHGIAMTTSA